MLATIDPKTGKAPEERVTSAFMVNAMADRYVYADQPRAIKRARVQAQLDGATPWNPKLLADTGQSDRSNVPFREGEGHVKARVTTYYNLIFDVKCLVTCAMTNPKLDDHDYAGTIAGKFHDMLMEWPGFIYNMMLHQQEMVTHWSGPVYWPDERSWRFRAAKHGSFLVDSGADSTLDTLENCLIRGTYKAHELFWKFYATTDEQEAGITDEDKRAVAAEHGWNYELAKELIVAANTGATKSRDDQYQTSIWETIEQQIKNNDTLYSDAQSELIQVRHWYQREFRGKVSWYIIPEKYPTKSQDEQPEKQFLFRQSNKYKDFTQVVCLFLTDIGSGSYHSGTGMGTRIYAHCAINDRMKNKMVDATDLAASIVVTGDHKDVRKASIGRFTIIPTGVQIVPNAFNPNIKDTLEVCEYLEKDLARNVGTDRPDMDDKGGKAMETATGERLRLSREGKLERTDIMLYYQQADQMLREIKRRVFLDGLAETDEAYESVQKFKKACKDAGVPEALLKDDAFSIEATRAVGFGSPAQAREIMSEVVSVAEHFPETGKVNAVRDYVTTLVGHRQVDRYCPEDDSAKDPTNQSSFAVMENSLMQLGEQVLVGRDQMHIAHLEVHMEPMQQIAKQFVSTGGVGDNPLKVHDFMLADLHHSAQHLDFIKSDPTRKPEYKKFTQMFDELLKVYSALDKTTKKLQQQLDEQRQAEMQKLQAQPQDGKAQAEIMKVQASIALNQAAEAKRQQLSEVRLGHTMKLKDEMAANSMRIANEEAARKGAMKNE
jgi:hypothetical protein